jgi:hypothetical protein
MPIAPSGFVNQRQLETAIRKAAHALAHDVVRMRYVLKDDSTGSEAIFFRILLTDRASRPDHLYETTERISEKILEIVQPRERFGIEAHFNYRSESEQATLREAAWE